MTTKRQKRQQYVLLRGELRYLTQYHKCERDGGAQGKEAHDQSHWESPETNFITTHLTAAEIFQSDQPAGPT